MKKISFLVVVFTHFLCFSQIAYTSFEEPSVFNIEYTDTGDPTIAHDLINNANEPFVDYTTSSGELGFNARFVPYDTPGDGLTDGDFVGVTNVPPTNDIPFSDGLQGYQMSDIDGNFILEFDIVTTTSNGNLELGIDYFISATGYEGDGTTNTAGSDRLRIYIRDLTNTNEINILDTTGSDINDLGIEGSWITGIASVLPNTNIQLVIEARTNSSAEAFFFDNIYILDLLNLENTKNNSFSIYPNPSANGFVYITSKNKAQKEISIFDILGNEVISTSIISDRVDISKLTNGIYILRIDQGTTSVTRKLIIY